ncbi:hypothetical protein EG68_07886 [Paragonimus skrjabini miyazakii]|uniref:PX domain-containing protein n=1 Tax=Paragonimus skrjabini miyazakii TaxID=59628 RepID=A0A8S9YFE0_9TREM|nr:hypothetical protein EG68_07886 [Paragonimus skrjabini miyazakii]
MDLSNEHSKEPYMDEYNECAMAVHSRPFTSTENSRKRPIIDLTIPQVVLRRRPAHQTHYVYMIHFRISTNIANAPLGTEQSVSEWTVGHRYTTLAELHAELMDRQDFEPEQNHNPSESKAEPIHAHRCLPRPLPGLEALVFPKKRRLPTVVTPMLPPSWLNCVNSASDQVDCLVRPGQSERVDQRRAQLEVYLRELVHLVWAISETTPVASVYNAMMAKRNDVGYEEPPIPDTQTAEGVKQRLLSLLPIFSP